MNLNTVMKAVHPVDRESLTAIARRATGSDAWFAGGTGLFSEPQPRIRRLIDLMAMNWQPLAVSDQGLSIAATCTLGTLAAFKAPVAWQASPLIARCCTAFPESFTNWGMATIGGNLCMALPSAPMISLCAALEGVCTVWTPAGGERQLSTTDFIRGPHRSALRPGEVLRSIRIPAEALSRTTAFRRISLTLSGFSDAFLIGTVTAEGNLTLTVTASTRRPLRFVFNGMPSEACVREKLAACIPPEAYYHEIHDRPDWCRRMTLDLGAEICGELRAAMPLRDFLSAASPDERVNAGGSAGDDPE